MNTVHKETVELAMEKVEKLGKIEIEQIELSFSDGPFVRTWYTINKVVFAEIEIYENKEIENIYRVSAYNLINILSK